MGLTSYEQACAEHRWDVPSRYNIASDVCDKHPRDKLAMVSESFDGSYRELTWGELQDLANQAAHVLGDLGVERGDRVAVVLPPTPETAAIFFGVWKLGAILLSMSVLYGDDSIRHRLSDSGAKLVVTDADNAPRFADTGVRTLVLDADTLAGASTEPVTGRHRRPTIPRSSTNVRNDRACERHRPRPSLHPRPRGVPVLPRGR